MNTTATFGKQPRLMWDGKMMRYLARVFFKTWLFTALCLGAMVFLVDVIETLASFADGTTFWQALSLAGRRLPTLLLQLAPFIVLLATLLTVIGLNRSRQLVVLRAVGVPARSFVLPLALFAGGIGALATSVWQPLSATFMQGYYAQTAALGQTEQTNSGVLQPDGSLWLQQKTSNGRLVIYAKNLLPAKPHATTGLTQPSGLGGAEILFLTKTGQLLERWDATELRPAVNASGELSRDAQTQWPLWQAHGVRQARPAENNDVTFVEAPHAQWPLPLPANVVQQALQPPETVPFWRLNSLGEQLQTIGLPHKPYALAFWQLIALPFYFFALVALAAPFAMRSSRRASILTMVVAGVVAGFVLYVLGNMLGAFALANRLPVAMAAFAPALLSGLVGLTLLFQTGEE